MVMMVVRGRAEEREIERSWWRRRKRRRSRSRRRKRKKEGRGRCKVE